MNQSPGGYQPPPPGDPYYGPPPVDPYAPPPQPGYDPYYGMPPVDPYAPPPDPYYGRPPTDWAPPPGPPGYPQQPAWGAPPATPPRTRRGRGGSGAVVFGLLLVIVGVWVLFGDQLDLDLDWGEIWPVAAVVVGALMVLASLMPGRGGRGD